MGVEKKITQEGNGVDRPKKGDKVAMLYTGWLYDASASNNDFKGKIFDSSEGRDEFTTQIGVGRVIKGWDDAILGADGNEGMSLGEKATLTITSDFAYGNRGFSDLIPPNSTLIFDVELVGINGKHV